MTNTTTSYSVEELAKLIEIAQKSGVEELTIEGFSVKLGKNQSLKNDVPKATPEILKAQAKIQEESQVESQLLRKEEFMNELLLLDPVKYEELLLNGELDDDGKPNITDGDDDEPDSAT